MRSKPMFRRMPAHSINWPRESPRRASIHRPKTVCGQCKSEHQWDVAEIPPCVKQQTAEYADDKSGAMARKHVNQHKTRQEKKQEYGCVEIHGRLARIHARWTRSRAADRLPAALLRYGRHYTTRTRGTMHGAAWCAAHVAIPLQLAAYPGNQVMGQPPRGKGSLAGPRPPSFAIRSTPLLEYPCQNSRH